MSSDQEFHYKKALKRQNFKEANVNELRELVKNNKNVPKSVSSKKVRKNDEPALKSSMIKILSDSALVFFECL